MRVDECPQRRRALLAGAFATLALMLPALMPSSAPALQDGGTDVQITRTGSLASVAQVSFNADVAYNSVRDEYLAVFASRPGSPPLHASEIEIYGRRLDASGQPLGDAFRISKLGVDGNPNAVTADPAVAYSPASDSYLVVFSGDGGQAPYVDNKDQIWSRLVSGDGTPVGAADQLISNIGSNTDATHDAQHPGVAWSAIANAFLVVFDVPVLPPGGPLNKIYSHRVEPDGVKAGGGNVFVSSTEPQSGADSATGHPSVGVNTNDGTWLVAWTAEPDIGRVAYDELEVFGHLMSTAGTRVGSDFRVSQTGPESDGDASAHADQPSIAFSPQFNEFLVIWTGDKGYPGAANQEFEILGQRVHATGLRLGDTIRISEIGTDGSPSSTTSGYGLTYNPVSREYIAVWSGDPATGQLVNDEFEIFGQRLSASGVPLGNDFRVGQTGADGDAASSASRPKIAAGAAGQYAGVWDGRPAGLKTEVYGDRLFTPIVSIGDGSAVEGSGQLVFPVLLTHPDPAGVPASVLAETIAGTAVPGSDYVSNTSLVTVFPGSASAAFTVALPPDGAIEATEQFGAKIYEPVNALLGTTTATGTIVDDDFPAPPPGPAPIVVPAPAKVQVLRAQVKKGRLDALLQITSRATGRLRVTYTSAGRTTRFSVPIARSSSPSARAAETRIRIDRKLPFAQRRKTTGILTIRYAGNSRVRADEVRLRAASGKALLKRTQTRLSGRTLTVAGTISRRAAGVVRIRMSYLEADNTVTLLKYSARIKRPKTGSRNTWSLRQKLPARAADVGGQVDIQFTGYERRRIRGEQLSKQVF